VASAVDYVEMTEFLLVNNADIDSKTYGEIQTPIHYAAKNGATRSLKMLLSFHANIDTLDAKQRTPLQVQALKSCYIYRTTIISFSLVPGVSAWETDET
jgi:ankyrin repeat protein